MPVRVLTVFAVLSLAACNVAPKSTDGAPDPALRARSDSLEAAEAALDKGRAIAFWAPDAIIQPAGMPQVNGRDSVAALYTFFFEKAGLKGLIGKPTQITMSQSGDLAFETGVNHLTFGSPKATCSIWASTSWSGRRPMASGTCRRSRSRAMRPRRCPSHPLPR
jgi:ketosteroid isomerase-like protein